MNRLALAVMILALPSALSAAQPTDALACSTVAACATTPCDFQAVGSWQSCGGTAPDSNDSWACSSNSHTLIFKGSSLTTADAYMNCKLLFDDSETGRDADGLRTLIIAGGITLDNGGPFLGPRHRLGIDSTAARRNIFQLDGGRFQAKGRVTQTTITAISAAAATNPPCNTTTGRMYNITPASGFSYARKKQRIIFQSGKAKGRSYEITRVGTPAGTFDVCTLQADGASDLQRLTPHATFDGSRTFPTNQHSVPTPIPASSCTGAGTPIKECTGSGTCPGCVEALPIAGDQIAIIEEAFLYNAAGSNGYYFAQSGGNQTWLPEFYAANVSGGASDSGIPCINFTATTNGTTVPGGLSYNNFHDSACGSGAAIRYIGMGDTVVEWNVGHDSGASSGSLSEAFFRFPANTGKPPNNITIRDNTFYRTRAGAIGLGGGFDADEGTGNAIIRNLIYDGCLTDSASKCDAILIANCPGCGVTNNVIYDWADGSGQQYSFCGITYSGNSPSDNNGAYANDNWIVNFKGTCYCGSGAALESEQVAFTHNYCSFNSGDGGGGSQWFSNVFKDICLQGVGDCHAIRGPAVAVKGNWILANSNATATSTDCTSGPGCTRFGIEWNAAASAGGKKLQTVQDNYIARLYNNPGGGGFAAGAMYFYELNPQFSLNFEHNDCDGRGATDFTYYCYWSTESGTSSPASTINVRDLVSMNMNGNAAVNCSAAPQPGYTRTIGNIYSLLTATTTEDGGNIAGNAECTGQSSGLTRVGNLRYKDPTFPNLNFKGGAAGLTAGASPASSPIGIRAFRFNKARMNGAWGGVLSFDGEFPANVCNDPVGCLDSDEDGVMDLHDNCDLTPNPSQYDADADGKGNACDATP